VKEFTPVIQGPDTIKAETCGEVQSGDEKRHFSARVYPPKLSGKSIRCSCEHHLLVSAVSSRGTLTSPFPSSSFSYPYPTKWGRYNKFSSCCDKDSAIIITCLRQPSLKLEWVLTTANAAGTGFTCLPKHRGSRDKKFWSPILTDL
jgi:hypothetical protein